MVRQTYVGLGLLTVEVSRQHSNIRHSVGLLWTSDLPVTKTLRENTKHTQQVDIHASRGIRPTIPASERPQIHALDCTASEIDRDYIPSWITKAVFEFVYNKARVLYVW
jgi:hypothetical protein